MPKVVRARAVELSFGGDGRVHALTPVSPVVIGPRPTFASRGRRALFLGAAAREAPLREVGRKRREQPHAPRLARLRLLHFPRDRALDEDPSVRRRAATRARAPRQAEVRRRRGRNESCIAEASAALSRARMRSTAIGEGGSMRRIRLCGGLRTARAGFVVSRCHSTAR